MSDTLTNEKYYIWHYSPSLGLGMTNWITNSYNENWIDYKTFTKNKNWEFYSSNATGNFDTSPVMNIYINSLSYDENSRELDYDIFLCGLLESTADGQQPGHGYSVSGSYFGYDICIGIGVFEKGNEQNDLDTILKKLEPTNDAKVNINSYDNSPSPGTLTTTLKSNKDAAWLIYKPATYSYWQDAECKGTITISNSLCDNKHYLGLLFYTTCPDCNVHATGNRGIRAYSLLTTGDNRSTIPPSTPEISGSVKISLNTSKNNFQQTIGSNTYWYSLLSSDGPSCALISNSLGLEAGDSDVYTAIPEIQTRIYFDNNSTGWKYTIRNVPVSDLSSGKYDKFISIRSNNNSDNATKISNTADDRTLDYDKYSAFYTYSTSSLSKLGRPTRVDFRARGVVVKKTDITGEVAAATDEFTDTEIVHLKLTNYTDKDQKQSNSMGVSYTGTFSDDDKQTYYYGDYIRLIATNSKYNGNNGNTDYDDKTISDRTTLKAYTSNGNFSTTPTLVIDDYNFTEEPSESYLIDLNNQGIAVLSNLSNSNVAQYTTCYLSYHYPGHTSVDWIDSDIIKTDKLRVKLRTPNAPEIEIITKENCNPEDVGGKGPLEAVYYLDPYNTYNSKSDLCLTIGLPIVLYASYPPVNTTDAAESGYNFPANIYHIFYKKADIIYNGDNNKDYIDYGQGSNLHNESTKYYWQYPYQWDSDNKDLTSGGITSTNLYFTEKNSFDRSVYNSYRALNSDNSDRSRTLYLYRCPRYLPDNDNGRTYPVGGQAVCNEEISGIDGYIPIDSKTRNTTTIFSHLFYLDYDGDWDNSKGQEEQDLPLFDDIPDDECNITVTSKVYVSFTNLQQRYNLGKFNYIKLEIVHSADENKIPINGTAGEVIDYSTTINYSSRDDEINRYDSSVDYIECIGNEEGQYGFGNYAGEKIKHLVLDVSKIISSNYLESNHYYKFRLTCGYVKNGKTVLSPNNEGTGYYNDERAVNTNVFTSSKMFRFNVAPYVQILYPAKDETIGKAYSSNPYPYTIFKVYNNEKLTDLGYRIDEVKITYTDKNEEDSREIKWIDETTDSSDKTTGYFPTMNLSTDKNWQSITYDNRVTNFTTQKQGDYEFPYEPTDYLGGEVTRGQIIVYRHNTMDNVQNGSNYPKFKVSCKNYFGWSNPTEDDSVIDYFYYNELNDAINNSSNKTKENGIAITDTQYILGNDVNDFLRCIQYLIPKGSSSTLVTGSWWNYNIVNLFYDFISTQNKIDNEDMSIIDKLIKSDKVDDIHNNYWLTTMMNDFLRELYHRIWALNPIRPNNLSYEISIDSNSNVVYGVVDKNLLLQSLHYIYGNYILFYCKENDGWYMISDEYSYDNNYNVTLTVDDDFKIIPINDDFFKNKDNLDNYCVKLKDNEFYSLGLQIISGNKNNLYTGYFIYIHIDSPSYIEGGEIDKNKYGNIIYGNNDYKDNKSKIKNNDYYIGNLVNNIVDYLTEMLS